MLDHSVIQCGLWALINLSEDCEENSKIMLNNSALGDLLTAIKRDIRDNRDMLEDIYSLENILRKAAYK